MHAAYSGRSIKNCSTVCNFLFLTALFAFFCLFCFCCCFFVCRFWSNREAKGSVIKHKETHIGKHVRTCAWAHALTHTPEK